MRLSEFPDSYRMKTWAPAGGRDRMGVGMGCGKGMVLGVEGSVRVSPETTCQDGVVPTIPLRLWDTGN